MVDEIKGKTSQRRTGTTKRYDSYFPEPEIVRLEQLRDRIYKLEAVPTGVANLGKLFYYTELQDGKPVVKILGGYPRGAMINLTGASDTGKSLMAQQYAIANALSERVIFLSTETPVSYLASSLKRIANMMKVDYSQVEKNIILVDLSRGIGSLGPILSKLSSIVKKTGARHLVIDSLTALFEDREVFARSVTREVYRFSKMHNLTTVSISQKREDSAFSAKSAGGLAIGHIVDCNIALSKIVISSPIERKIYGRDIGDTVRTLRIDGCRLCGHSSKTFLIEITKEGLVSLIGPLSKPRSSMFETEEI